MGITEWLSQEQPDTDIPPLGAEWVREYRELRELNREVW
jgi:hypothetical protein